MKTKVILIYLNLLKEKKFHCDECKKQIPLFINLESHERKRNQNTLEKEKNQRKIIEQDSNKKFKEIANILFKSNENMKNYYHDQMIKQHNFVLKVNI